MDNSILCKFSDACSGPITLVHCDVVTQITIVNGYLFRLLASFIK